MMHADSFDDLVAACVTSGVPHRLLYVFVRIGTMDAETKAEILGEDAADEDAGFIQVLFDAHQPAAPGLTFEQVQAAADAHSPDWDLLIVGVARNADASPPNDDQAAAALTDMRDRVLAGDVDDCVIIDRSGQSIGDDDTPTGPLN